MSAYTGAVPLSMAELMTALGAFPHEVSTNILRPMSFASFLDAGCGTNPALAQYVIEQKGAFYVGIDNGIMKDAKGRPVDTERYMQANLRRRYAHVIKKPFETYKGDVCNMPPEIQAADVVHMRFVLMHMSAEDAAIAIKQLVPRAKKALLLAEYNWATMKSTDRFKIHIENFVEASLQFMKAFKVNPYIGQSLPALTAHLPAVTHATHQRAEGSYLSELIALCIMQKERAQQANMPRTMEKFQALEGLFKFFIQKETPIIFTPPAICTALIKTPSQQD